MKVRESGMPEPGVWEAFFDTATILDRMLLDGTVANVIEFGTGYGTFTLPAAGRVSGIVHSLDIEPSMLAATRSRAAAAGILNVRFSCRDFVSEGSGLAGESVDYAMLFNILHCEHPVELLREARRVLRVGGRLGIIHWNYDPDTPRGPPMAIRPTPAQCHDWALQAGFETLDELIDLPPHHYGVLMRR